MYLELLKSGKFTVQKYTSYEVLPFTSNEYLKSNVAGEPWTGLCRWLYDNIIWGLYKTV